MNVVWYRKNREASPWRDRPVAESLALFEDMRRGLMDEGKATLRSPPIAAHTSHGNPSVNLFCLYSLLSAMTWVFAYQWTRRQVCAVFFSTMTSSYNWM